MHPVLDSLVGTPMAWLRGYLFQFNRGDIDGFEQTIKSPEFAKQVPDFFLFLKKFSLILKIF